MPKFFSFHKNRIFQWTPKILKSFILNSILSFKKVTKFRDKISHLNSELWRKKIFLFICYFCFLSFCISDFYFLCQNWNPLKKGHLFFPSNPLPKMEVLSNPLLENVVGDSPPPPIPPRNVWVHTMRILPTTIVYYWLTYERLNGINVKQVA